MQNCIFYRNTGRPVIIELQPSYIMTLQSLVAHDIIENNRYYAADTNKRARNTITKPINIY